MFSEYQKIEVFCQFLPLNDTSPAYPFSNWVINFGAATKAHRDSGDNGWCVSFTFAACDGGQLCLYELGLVFDCDIGDMVVFQSDKQTHFNLHIKGIRGSLVLHCDRTGYKWGDNYNRWGPYVN
jgi:hypothetical protein